jgi:hypothetical protein
MGTAAKAAVSRITEFLVKSAILDQHGKMRLTTTFSPSYAGKYVYIYLPLLQKKP